MERTSELTKRLLMLTLALEQALQAENWAESDALFRDRGRLLDKLERTKAKIPANTYEDILRSERRAFQSLGQSRAKLIELQKENLIEGRAIGAYYGGRKTAASFDSFG